MLTDLQSQESFVYRPVSGTASSLNDQKFLNSSRLLDPFSLCRDFLTDWLSRFSPAGSISGMTGSFRVPFKFLSSFEECSSRQGTLGRKFYTGGNFVPDRGAMVQFRQTAKWTYRPGTQINPGAPPDTCYIRHILCTEHSQRISNFEICFVQPLTIKDKLKCSGN
jgi:hypothetical protein